MALWWSVTGPSSGRSSRNQKESGCGSRSPSTWLFPEQAGDTLEVERDLSGIRVPGDLRNGVTAPGSDCATQQMNGGPTSPVVGDACEPRRSGAFTVVQAQLGHSSLAVTTVYLTHLDAFDLAAALTEV